jgi:cytoskeletal protein RodZ
MSFSGREYKAQQRRISDSNRRIKLKALFQKEKDRLRAEQRRERQQEREEEKSDSSDSVSDRDCDTQEARQSHSCYILSLFLVFLIFYTLLVWQFFVSRRV